MKATGIVRRIDELGRIVIPKEIRRTLRIRESDPLEIFTDNEGSIILKKYSPIGEMGALAEQYADSLSQAVGALVCVTDTDRIIAASGNGKKDFLEKSITKELRQALSERIQIKANFGERKFIKITESQNEEYESEVIDPIICEGDIIGSVCILKKAGKGQAGEMEQKLALCASIFLGRQMEQ